MSDVCVELQNIKYQTMLLNGNSTVVSNKTECKNNSKLQSKEPATFHEEHHFKASALEHNEAQ